MDAFYASVEQRNNPRLKGKPVIVGGRPDSRGVVSTCSYEARRYGIHSAMPAAEAYRRCPHGIFITQSDFGEYRKVSEQVHGIFHEVSDLVEPLSLDEAFIDVTSNKLGEKSATRIAEYIRRRIVERTKLTASAGVSFNKSLAKIASDWDKPDGLTVIRPQEAEKFLESLPVRKFFGVGPVTASRMESLGIHTGGDLRQWPLYRLIEEFGKAGPWYYDICRGKDDREVVVERIRKSLGKERTFQRDKTDLNEMIVFLSKLCEAVWQELEERCLRGKTVTVKVKYADFRQVTRSRTVPSGPQNLRDLQRTVIELLKETDAADTPVRLLGASVSSFGDTEENDETSQLNLGLTTAN